MAGWLTVCLQGALDGGDADAGPHRDRRIAEKAVELSRLTVGARGTEDHQHDQALGRRVWSFSAVGEEPFERIHGWRKSGCRGSAMAGSCITRLCGERWVHVSRSLPGDGQLDLLTSPGGLLQLWLRGFHHLTSLQRRPVRDVAAEGVPELGSVIGIDLRVIPTARHGDVRQAPIDELLSSSRRVHMHDHAIRGLALGFAARHAESAKRARS